MSAPAPSAITTAKQRLGPMRDLLARHGITVRGRALSCPHPDHDDRHPSAGVYVARDGDERVRCWSCGLDEDVIGIARLLGERVDLRTPSGPAPRRRVPPHPELERAVRRLARRDDWLALWAAAQVLASVPRAVAQRDVASSWAHLSESFDLPLLVELSDLIREAADARFGGNVSRLLARVAK